MSATSGSDAAAGKPAQEDHRPQGDRDHDRHYGADSAQDRVEGRCGNERLHAQAWPCLSAQERLDDAVPAVAARTAFDHPAHQIVLQEMVEAVRLSKERVERLEQTIEEFVPNWSLAPMVRALQALRGIISA